MSSPSRFNSLAPVLSRRFAHVRPRLRSLLHVDSPTRDCCRLSSLLVALPRSLRFSVKCKRFALPLELVVKSPLLHFVRMCAISNERCACRSHDGMRDKGGETKEMTWTSEAQVDMSAIRAGVLFHTDVIIITEPPPSLSPGCCSLCNNEKES